MLLDLAVSQCRCAYVEQMVFKELSASDSRNDYAFAATTSVVLDFCEAGRSEGPLCSSTLWVKDVVAL